MTKLSQVGFDEFPSFLFDLEKEYEGKEVVIVYENFKLMRGRALQQSGSAMETSQVIGQLKMIATKAGWKIYDQAPNIKSIAVKWSGTPAPKNHAISHQVDAYNHGIYWLVKNGMRKIETE